MSDEPTHEELAELIGCKVETIESFFSEDDAE